MKAAIRVQTVAPEQRQLQTSTGRRDLLKCGSVISTVRLTRSGTRSRLIMRLTESSSLDL